MLVLDNKAIGHCLEFAPRSESFAYVPSAQLAQFPRYPESFRPYANSQGNKCSLRSDEKIILQYGIKVGADYSFKM